MALPPSSGGGGLLRRRRIDLAFALHNATPVPRVVQPAPVWSPGGSAAARARRRRAVWPWRRRPLEAERHLVDTGPVYGTPRPGRRTRAGDAAAGQTRWRGRGCYGVGRTAGRCALRAWRDRRDGALLGQERANVPERDQGVDAQERERTPRDIEALARHGLAPAVPPGSASRHEEPAAMRYQPGRYGYNPRLLTWS